MFFRHCTSKSIKVHQRDSTLISTSHGNFPGPAPRDTVADLSPLYQNQIHLRETHWDSHQYIKIMSEDMSPFTINKQIEFEAAAVVNRAVYYEFSISISRKGLLPFQIDLKHYLQRCPFSRGHDLSRAVKIKITLRVDIAYRIASYTSRWFDREEIGEESSLGDRNASRQWACWL